MSRASSPGGRFTADFEARAISDAIDMDLKRPVGTQALWYYYNEVDSVVDELYDVGGQPPYTSGAGKVWSGPFSLPLIKAVIGQGSTKMSQAGLYNADTLHLTINAKDIEKILPGVMDNPDDQNRSRVVWKNQVFRPFNVQQKGIISEGFVLLVIECSQVMPEEMVNDPQFLQFSSN